MESTDEASIGGLVMEYDDTRGLEQVVYEGQKKRALLSWARCIRVICQSQSRLQYLLTHKRQGTVTTLVIDREL